MLKHCKILLYWTSQKYLPKISCGAAAQLRDRDRRPWTFDRHITITTTTTIIITLHACETAKQAMISSAVRPYVCRPVFIECVCQHSNWKNYLYRDWCNFWYGAPRSSYVLVTFDLDLWPWELFQLNISYRYRGSMAACNIYALPVSHRLIINISLFYIRWISKVKKIELEIVLRLRFMLNAWRCARYRFSYYYYKCYNLL